MPAKTLFAQLIARREGFGIAGDKPTRDHNPGDLEHAPHLVGWDGAIGIEPNDDAGWADLERQLELYASRNMTIAAAVDVYAPPNENDSEAYLQFVCHGLGLPPTAMVMDALKQPALP